MADITVTVNLGLAQAGLGFTDPITGKDIRQEAGEPARKSALESHLLKRRKLILLLLLVSKKDKK